MKTVIRFLLSVGLFAALFTAPLASAATCAVGTVGAAPVASITFSAPTTNTDGTPITGTLTYELFQGTATGQEKLVASALAGSPISVKTGLADAVTYYWYVEAVNSAGNASAPSNEVCKTFPAGVPSAITITVT